MQHETIVGEICIKAALTDIGARIYRRLSGRRGNIYSLYWHDIYKKQRLLA